MTKIVKARSLGQQQVYDLSMEHEHHSFALASDVVSHNCAFAICDRPVYDFIPMTEIGGVKCTQYTAASVEAAGALKMDFLVVNSIHDIQDALKLIQQRSDLSIPHSTTINGKSVPWQRIVPWRGQLLDIWDLPEDQDVAREIAEGKTETVFQFSTPGAKQHLRNFNYWKDRASGRKAIDGINAMAAFTALDRPGPLDAYVQSPDGKQHNMLVEYARRSRGEVPCGNIAIFDALFPETLGTLTYQEQLQLLYQNLTGCSGSEAEEFRSLVAKKKMEKVQAKYPDWMKKAGEKLGEQEAQTVWNTIITWGQYGFNKSHSVCYVHIAYACAWLKHHYPLEWWCAVLGNAAKKEVGENFWAHCGHLVDMPDVNNPSSTFAIVGDRIRAPVALISGIGAAAQRQLAELGPFTDIVDLVAKVEAWRQAHRKPKIDKSTGTQAKTKKGELQWTLATTALNRGVVGTLIATGCMDSLFPSDMLLEERLEAYERALAEARGGEQQPIPQKYLNLTAVDRYRMTKKVLPVYDEPLMPLLRTGDADAWPLSALQGTARAPIFETPKGGIPVVSWEMFQRLENKSPWPEDHEIVIALPVYITAQRLFDYQQKSKTACELVMEIEGSARKYVRWPDRKTGNVPATYRKPLVGALALAFFKRYTEKRPFGLEDVVVFHWPQEKEQDNDAAQEEG